MQYVLLALALSTCLNIAWQRRCQRQRGLMLSYRGIAVSAIAGFEVKESLKRRLELLDELLKGDHR
jgi:hypothetical protein